MPLAWLRIFCRCRYGFLTYLLQRNSCRWRYFSANHTENNKVEQIKFTKSKIYAISRLSIDQDTQSNVSLPNVEGKKALSNILRTYGEEKTKFNLDLKIYKGNYFDINDSFQKRTDVLITGFQYYHTTIQKQEASEFHDYYYHL